MFFGLEFEFWTHISPPIFSDDCGNDVLATQLRDARRALREYQVASAERGGEYLPRFAGPPTSKDEDNENIFCDRPLTDGPQKETINLGRYMSAYMGPILEPVVGQICFEGVDRWDQSYPQDAANDYSMWSWTTDASLKLMDTDIELLVESSSNTLKRAFVSKEENWGNFRQFLHWETDQNDDQKAFCPWIQSELITRILRWDVAPDHPDSYRSNIRPFLAKMQEDKPRALFAPIINPTCGMHVHVSILPECPQDPVWKLTDKQRLDALTCIVQKLAFILLFFEPVLDKCHSLDRTSKRTVVLESPASLFQRTISSQVRSNLQYVVSDRGHNIPFGSIANWLSSEPRTLLDVQKFMNPDLALLRSGKDAFWKCENKLRSTRKYYKYNILNAETYGTVEFRQAGMTFDTVPVEEWVGLCCRIVEMARIVTWADIEALCWQIGKPTLQHAIEFFQYEPLRGMVNAGLDNRINYHRGTFLWYNLDRVDGREMTRAANNQIVRIAWGINDGNTAVVGDDDTEEDWASEDERVNEEDANEDEGDEALEDLEEEEEDEYVDDYEEDD